MIILFYTCNFRFRFSKTDPDVCARTTKHNLITMYVG